MTDFNQFFNLEFWQKIFELNESPLRIAIAILDIAIISFFLYQAIRFVQGTKLMTLVRGVIIFIFIRIIAGLIGLTTVEWLLNQVITYGVIAGVIIFQPEKVALMGIFQLTRNLLLTCLSEKLAL